MDVLLMARRCAKALRTTVGALAVLAFVASPAAANAGKVLVFTGTAGTPNASSADAATAIQALGDGQRLHRRRHARARRSINARQPRRLPRGGVRPLVRQRPRRRQEAALQDYVQAGGGFVGIGETALLEQGGAAFFNTLTGLSGGAHHRHRRRRAPQDVEFLDRVHPATRAAPARREAQDRDLVHVGHEPDGHGPHRRPRARQHAARRHVDHQRRGPALHRRHGDDPAAARTAPPPGAVTSSRAARSTPRSAARPRAWPTPASSKHLLGAIQWAAGMVRGGCKAGDQLQLLGDAHHAAATRPASNTYYGEMTKSALADDGRIFYGGRAICFQGYAQIGNWDSPNTGLGCGTIHVWDPRVEGSNDQNPAKISAGRQPLGLRRQGQRHRVRPDLDLRGRPGRHDARPGLHQGPPVRLHPVLPVLGRRAGQGHRARSSARASTGARYKGEKRLSRFTYDEATKTFVPGSEKVIFSYTSPVYNCCHNGAGMAWDSKGNLYVTNGDNVPNGTRQRRQQLLQQQHRRLHQPAPAASRIPCPGAGADDALRRDVPEDRAAGRHRPADQLRRRARHVGQHERLRGQDHPHQAAREPG